VLLGAAVAVRGRCSGPADVPCFLVQGVLGASPPRFEMRLWLPDGCTERARRGRACASTAVATHHGMLWTRSQGSLVCLRTPAAARSTCTFHVLVLAVAVRSPCVLVGMLCLGAGIVDATATPRAAPLVTRALLRVGVRGNPRASVLVNHAPQRGATAGPEVSRTPPAAPVRRAPMPSALVSTSRNRSGRRGRPAGQSLAAW
jgi:hypothetical protein